MDLTLQAGFGTYGFIVSRYCVYVSVSMLIIRPYVVHCPELNPVVWQMPRG